MSDFERGMREAMQITVIFVVAVLFGPWLLLVIAAWLLEPRTGSWGDWPTYLGVGWALLVCAVVTWWLTRK